MVIVCFPDGGEWGKANWVFRRLVKYVLQNFPEDSDLKAVLERAVAFGTLNFGLLDNQTALRVRHAIKTGAENSLQFRTTDREERMYIDRDEEERLYRESVLELLDLLRGMEAEEQAR